MKRIFVWWMLLAALIGSLPVDVRAQDRKVIVYEKPKPAAVQWAVWVPETTETFTARYDREKARVGLAQGVIEQELMDAGFQLVSLNITATSSAYVLNEAAAAGADYLLTGEASVTRILSSESGSVGGGTAIQTGPQSNQALWGSVNKPENSANIQIRIFRVADGKLMRTESAASTGSASARRGGAQGALNEAVQRLMRNLIPDMEDILRDHHRSKGTDRESK